MHRHADKLRGGRRSKRPKAPVPHQVKRPHGAVQRCGYHHTAATTGGGRENTPQRAAAPTRRHKGDGGNRLRVVRESDKAEAGGQAPHLRGGEEGERRGSKNDSKIYKR